MNIVKVEMTPNRKGVKLIFVEEDGTYTVAAFGTFDVPEHVYGEKGVKSTQELTPRQGFKTLAEAESAFRQLTVEM